MKITIVSYDWPPRNAIATQRPLSWAREWSKAGHQVTVLTSHKYKFDEPLDLVEDTIPGVQVITTRPGFALSLVGLIAGCRFFQQLNKLRSRGGRPAPDQGKSDIRNKWQHLAEGQARRLALRSEIVVSTFGPSSAHAIGAAMKIANPNLIWIADYRDLPASLSSKNLDKKKPLPLPFPHNLVRLRADLAVGVSQPIVEALGSALQTSSTIVPNGFDGALTSLGNMNASTSSGGSRPIRIVHTGTVYAGSRDPSLLLEAIAALDEEGVLSETTITVDFYGSRVAPVEKLSKSPRLGKFVRLMGHVSHRESLSAQKQATLLLLLEGSNMQAQGVLTGKIFEYIFSGVPIICIGSRPEFEIGRTLASTGSGRVYWEPQDFKTLQVDLQAAISGLRPNFYAPNKNEILRYTREDQSKRFLSIIGSLYDDRGGANKTRAPVN